MADWQILSVTAAAILVIVVLIIRVRLSPVVALVIGAAGLGLATKLGVEETVNTLMHGFGDIMYEVGLLIGWGVLMGSLLNETGAIRRLVDGLLKTFGAKGVPYALGLTLGTALQSIFLDVLLVMSAPLARRIAPHLGRLGTAKVASAMAISLEAGIVLMVPGVAALALAGLLSVPLGTMLIWGFVVIVPTIITAIAIMNFLFNHGFWNPELDEMHEEDVLPADAIDNGGEPSTVPVSVGALETDGAYDRTPDDGAEDNTGLTKVGLFPHTDTRVQEERPTPLILLFAPMLLSLVLIASGAILDIWDISWAPLDFLSSPVVALLIGLLGTSIVARISVGAQRVESALTAGFRESGQILLLTGAGGSLAAIVATSGMGDLLGKYFTATSFAPLIVVWAIAAVLHVAVGSVSISAITAAGLLAPVAGQIGLNPVLLALAAGAGSMFLVHVTSNTFWLLQSMLGQTTRGTFKTCSVGVSVASVCALVYTLVLSIFL